MRAATASGASGGSVERALERLLEEARLFHVHGAGAREPYAAAAPRYGLEFLPTR